MDELCIAVCRFVLHSFSSTEVIHHQTRFEVLLLVFRSCKFFFEI